MSNNTCLVTKLKGTVNNNSLEKLGYVRIKARQLASTSNLVSRLYITTNNTPTTVKIIGNGYFTEAYDAPESARKTEATYQSTIPTTIFLSNGDYEIEISNKYNISVSFVAAMETIAVIPWDKLGVMPKQTEVTPNSGSPIDLSCVPVNFPNLKSIELTGDFVSGDTSSIKDMTTLTRLKLQWAARLTGSVADFAKLVNLVQLTLPGTQITGSIEDFVAGQVANGRTSVEAGVFSTYGVLNRLTFGGTLYGINESGFIAWDGASKIILYTGNSVSYEQATTIYAKGASASEISAWEQASKTVIQVS